MGYALPVSTSTRDLLKDMVASRKARSYEALILMTIDENKELKIKNNELEKQIKSLQETINSTFSQLASNGDLKNGND